VTKRPYPTRSVGR